jgi:large subunit ribosomal protein L1
MAVSKKYKEAAAKVNRQERYSVADAIKLMKETSIAKFDATVEVAFNLNIDPKKADQQLRGAIVLPAGTGKTQKVLVLTSTKTKEAQEANADFIGAEDMIYRIQNEN